MVVIMVMVMMRRFDDNNKPNTRVAVCACAAKKMRLMFGARAPRMALGCTHKVFRSGMPVNALLAMLVMSLLVSTLHAITCQRWGWTNF